MRQSQRGQEHGVQRAHGPAPAHGQLGRQNRGKRLGQGARPPGRLGAGGSAGRVFAVARFAGGGRSRRRTEFFHTRRGGGGMRRHLSGARAEPGVAGGAGVRPHGGVRQHDGRGRAPRPVGGSQAPGGAAGAAGGGRVGAQGPGVGRAAPAGGRGAALAGARARGAPASAAGGSAAHPGRVAAACAASGALCGASHAGRRARGRAPPERALERRAGPWRAGGGSACIAESARMAARTRGGRGDRAGVPGSGGVVRPNGAPPGAPGRRAPPASARPAFGQPAPGHPGDACAACPGALPHPFGRQRAFRMAQRHAFGL